jgi:hypothetical protein
VVRALVNDSVTVQGRGGLRVHGDGATGAGNVGLGNVGLGFTAVVS